MRKAKRMVSLLPAGALCLGLIACGSDGPSSPTVATTPAPPPAPVQAVVAQGSISGLEPLFVTIRPPFSTSATGTIDVTVDWTFPANDVDVYLARGACSFEQLVADQCIMAGFSESLTAKPEKVSVPNAAAGTYTLVIANWGPGTESLSYQVTLTAVPGAQSQQGEAMRVRPSRNRGLVGVVR